MKKKLTPPSPTFRTEAGMLVRVTADITAANQASVSQTQGHRGSLQKGGTGFIQDGGHSREEPGWTLSHIIYPHPLNDLHHPIVFAFESL